jgi:hypothetical protein
MYPLFAPLLFAPLLFAPLLLHHCFRTIAAGHPLFAQTPCSVLPERLHRLLRKPICEI